MPADPSGPQVGRLGRTARRMRFGRVPIPSPRRGWAGTRCHCRRQTSEPVRPVLPSFHRRLFPNLSKPLRLPPPCRSPIRTVVRTGSAGPAPGERHSLPWPPQRRLPPRPPTRLNMSILSTERKDEWRLSGSTRAGTIPQDNPDRGTTGPVRERRERVTAVTLPGVAAVRSALPACCLATRWPCRRERSAPGRAVCG